MSDHNRLMRQLPGGTAGSSSSAEANTGGQATRATRRHRHDAPHRPRQQERRLGIEPVEERVLLSAAPVVGPQLLNLQTLNVAALTATLASQTTARPWADVSGFLALTNINHNYAMTGDGHWTLAFSGATTSSLGNSDCVASDVRFGSGTAISVRPATAPESVGPVRAPASQNNGDSASSQPGSGTTRPVEPLPEPNRAPPLRISEADLQPTSRRAGLMIDTTLRQNEQHLLATAQTAYRQELLAAQAVGVEQAVGGPQGAETRQLHDVRLDTPTPADTEPLNGQRGRAQAFDLALRPTPAATPNVESISGSGTAALGCADRSDTAEGGCATRIEAIALAPELPPQARDTTFAASESTAHDAVFAEMNDSAIVAGPVRLDIGQSRRVMAMLIAAMLATELAPWPDRLDEDGTYLHPLPSRHPIPKAGR